MARVYLLESDPLYRTWTRSILEAAGHSVVLRLRPNQAADAAVVSAMDVTLAEATLIQDAIESKRVVLLKVTMKDQAVERLLGPVARTLLRRDDRPFTPRELLACLAVALRAPEERAARSKASIRAAEGRVGP